MKALCALLMLLPMLAQAAPWAKAGGDKGSTVYIDRSTIRKTEEGRKAWTLQSFDKDQSAPDGKPYRSLRAQHIYDCEARTITLKTQLLYAGPMARGEALGTYKYESFDPEEVGEKHPYAGAMKAVCKRK
ncbi:surface-adhesin E family protein [Massilia endophytica]|uniref:surface-adhesin E family protein n=1 Tax=Massilia endophytica TaxID=2899220 RepID=UPI001E284225|nr:surface-adhesin E family protein [Massilia endophytica]UGQ45273.1 hypothetical protein LSQ66_15925 [Massilia endophytica]